MGEKEPCGHQGQRRRIRCSKHWRRHSSSASGGDQSRSVILLQTAEYPILEQLDIFRRTAACGQDPCWSKQNTRKKEQQTAANPNPLLPMLPATSAGKEEEELGKKQ